MGKKKLMKFSSSNSSSTSNANNLSGCSFNQDIAGSNSNEVSALFKVLICQNSEDKDKYNKWTRNCYWKNIVFLRPTVLSGFGCNYYALIEGKSNCAMFMAKPLKCVNRGSIVLLNGLGFDNEETVTLRPLKEASSEAKEIFFASGPHDFLRNMFAKKLSNRFIWCGLKLQCVLFDVKSECVISKVLPHEEFSGSNCLPEDISCLFSTLSLQKSVDCFSTSYRSTIHPSPESPPPSGHVRSWSRQIEIIRNYVDTFLKTTRDDKILGCTHHMLLLSGASGSAQNVNTILNECGIHTIKINMPSFKNASAAMEEIKLVIKNATKSFPSFLMLDKFDLFCSLIMKDCVSNLFRHLNKICGDQVLVVATLSSEFAFDKQLLNSFSVQEVKFPLPPTFDDREEMIEEILKEQRLSSSQIKHCAELLQGLSGGDVSKILKIDAPLLSLVRRGNSSFIPPQFLESQLSFCDIETAIKKRKSTLLSSNLKANKVKWSDIGGMETTKKELIEELELLTLTPREKLELFDYSPSRGILLYGPPGCSKTMIAKALATECNWNFISKKASDIMNMYVGESEKAITNLFLEARVGAPCIIFLDEIDAIAPARNSSSEASGVQNRVVNCLLSEMAGIETLKDILIIAATNRPDIIDDALLRRGRIGKLIYVPLPDCRTRKELFRLSMRKRRVSDDVDFKDLVERTEGYTGAEIVQVCNEAAIQLLVEDPFCQSPVLKKEHFERALLTTLPLTHKDAIHFYEQFGSKNSKERGALLKQ